MLRGKPMIPPSAATASGCASEIAGRAERSCRGQPLVFREVGPVGDREELREGPHRPAHGLRRDDFKNQAADQNRVTDSDDESIIDANGFGSS